MPHSEQTEQTAEGYQELLSYLQSQDDHLRVWVEDGPGEFNAWQGSTVYDAMRRINERMESHSVSTCKLMFDAFPGETSEGAVSATRSDIGCEHISVRTGAGERLGIYIAPSVAPESSEAVQLRDFAKDLAIMYMGRHCSRSINKAMSRSFKERRNTTSRGRRLRVSSRSMITRCACCGCVTVTKGVSG